MGAITDAVAEIGELIRQHPLTTSDTERQIFAVLRLVADVIEKRTEDPLPPIDHWVCSCGASNILSASQCHSCGRAAFRERFDA